MPCSVTYTDADANDASRKTLIGDVVVVALVQFIGVARFAFGFDRGARSDDRGVVGYESDVADDRVVNDPLVRHVTFRFEFFPLVKPCHDDDFHIFFRTVFEAECFAFRIAFAQFFVQVAERL